MKIGVLSLQGGVIEHINHLKKLDIEAIEVKKIDDLKNIDGIILPGGESTTIGKLLKDTNIFLPLKALIQSGLPTWGTCAGMILLAKEIENDERRHLQVMDIKVKRNAFGSQIDSFKRIDIIPEVSNKPIELVFIRAPYIREVGNNVHIIHKVEDKVVAAKQNNILVTSFHPELTDDLSFHRYFINMIK
ncbi:pyridoxal 5'-phosphate synthase glutaminase subunit PdxT [Caloramator proteoclasticus]|uniref:Pyridoxal 5'-phosphate synthase subunit PdxT n=1 Tax=Caloramator proteoclasticus DSM 10124 TaxID=1121262 RepID=A0A1M4Y2J3_9CLOT|nr:pyridoxal 5'-phosphate synthase glutaminase subunit PdxT [Caloramator proteoclasticus]SHE99925.1 5'-phosphate synthase pdxT subunit [Caloramator proteoclasticus DSM 10124]